ncbi:iron-only hydrogenase system regulator [candidate division KSB1 bacterium]|nr:iron-only hydrogenase system regulator [candidate division KSB1 bacterium]
MNSNQPTENKRLGVVSIFVHSRDEAYKSLNQILHTYADLIVGRLGLPYRERQIGVIALIVDGTTDEIGAMTGKIGQLQHVTVKTVLAKLPTPNADLTVA